jgi:hypothetical protein
MRKSSIIKLLLVSIAISSSIVKGYSQKGDLKKVIQSDSKFLKPILSDPKYEVQIIYTQINRDSENIPSFTCSSFGINDKIYFYPASTVKMPVAFLALEKVNNLNIPELDRDANIKIGVNRKPQSQVIYDKTSNSGRPSLSHYIKKIFLVSDNDAYNRLYEFCGQEYINKSLKSKGYENTKIVHRLDALHFSPEDNRYTNPITLYKDGIIHYFQDESQTTIKYSKSFSHLQGLNKGSGFIDTKGVNREGQFNFSQKNYISLQDLHDVLKSVLFPNSVMPNQRFNLTNSDYTFVYKSMSSFPNESKYPDYSEKEDGYVKFIMFGDQPDSIPDHIRIFNKVGLAYGYLTDVAYVVDFKNKIEFIVAASIHTNENQIYNDGNYEYDSIGFPFMGHLGRAIYNFELSRKKKYAPDLSRFKFSSYE